MNIADKASNPQVNSNGQPVYAIILPQIKETSGLAWIYVMIINRLAKALEQGYIPIIDLQHNNNQYFKDGRKFKDNTWEYYFKQPCGISLKDLDNIGDNSQVKILIDDSDFTNIPGSVIKLQRVLNSACIEKFPYKKEALKYIKLSDDAQQYIDDKINRLIGNESEILGILCRGTDYIRIKPKQHSIPATPEMLIKEAKELKSKYHYKKIYVATEDLEIYNKFKDAFGELLIPNNQYMYGNYEHSNTIYLSSIEVNRPNHKYQLGMEYLCSMYILSNCKYFISSNSCAGVDLASRFSNFFSNMEYVHIWERGSYGYHKAEYKNFPEKLFSIKNEYNDNIVRKVITILGIKIKFVKEIK